jgi:ABC-type nitrate/sulfonate/bicarbonate transport system substrate-binding protein
VRSFVVFGILLVMLTAFVVVTYARQQPVHHAPALPVPDAVAQVPAEPSTHESRDKGASPSMLHSDDPAAPLDDPGQSAGTPGLNRINQPTPPPPLELPQRSATELAASTPHSLRVVGLGWPLLAPALVANRGTSPGAGSLFRARGIHVQLTVVDSAQQVARALARGGAHQEGADVAIMPLPLFVAAYDPLRALAPKVFFVVGWSQGEEELRASRPDALLRLPASGEVPLVTAAGSSAHFFGLFLLDLAGVPPARVTEVAPGHEEAGAVVVAAQHYRQRDPASGPGPRALLVTTGQAPGLIPYVAVAPQGLIDRHADRLSAFCQAWLEGTGELQQDVPTAARRIATASDAPDALELLARLGRLGHADVTKNAQFAGLSGRGAVTIDELFARAWRVWRDAGVVTSPSPPARGFAPEIITALVHSQTGPPAPPEARETNSDEQTSSGPPLLVHRLNNRPLEASELVGKIGWLAGLFEPLTLRVAVAARSEPGLDAVMAQARDRFDLPETRLVAAPRPARRRASATIELLSPP